MSETTTPAPFIVRAFWAGIIVYPIGGATFDAIGHPMLATLCGICWCALVGLYLYARIVAR